MMYSTRFRIKETLGPDGLAEVNRMLDTEVIPAALDVAGVNTFAVYQSSNGELVALLDVVNLAAVDNILADPGCRAAFGKFYALTVRSGGEILFDRPAWQALYGKGA